LAKTWLSKEETDLILRNGTSTKRLELSSQ